MRRGAAVVLVAALVLSGCGGAGPEPGTGAAPAWAGREDSLASLVKLDDHPLWTMRYAGGYDPLRTVGSAPPTTPFGCSLFLAGDADAPLFARNFDWDPNPAMLLFTDPPRGHASVSMVDLSYLGVSDPAADPDRLADAPLLPFDGMNERGLAIGLAAVPDADAGARPERPTVGGVRIIRLVLDRAATVEEAVAVFEEHNVDFSGGPPLHYLVADASGKSVVVEFVDGEVRALPIRTAVNFTVAGTTEQARQDDARYRTATAGLSGARDWRGAMALLDRVQQGHTQWSVVYGLTTGEIHLATDKRFDRVHEHTLPMTG